eukprot:Lankesteria_metandrocarpae@DN650_c0_g1_i1.p1
MRVVALVSGGKDSVFSILCCEDLGHEVTLLAHLTPRGGSVETDSYMYQSIGTEAIPSIAEALGIPLVMDAITGMPVDVSLHFDAAVQDADEVEDLQRLLQACLVKDPTIEGVVCGAIMSNYQRIRLERICQRLRLRPVAPLWRLPQAPLLDCMIENGIDARIVKVACDGLNQTQLGHSIAELRSYFHKLMAQGFNVCGEGGEYETLTLDCPRYNKTVVLDSHEVVQHGEWNPWAPTVLMRPTAVSLKTKLNRDERRPLTSDAISVSTGNCTAATLTAPGASPVRVPIPVHIQALRYVLDTSFYLDDIGVWDMSIPQVRDYWQCIPLAHGTANCRAVEPKPQWTYQWTASNCCSSCSSSSSSSCGVCTTQDTVRSFREIVTVPMDTVVQFLQRHSSCTDTTATSTSTSATTAASDTTASTSASTAASASATTASTSATTAASDTTASTSASTAASASATTASTSATTA